MSLESSKACVAVVYSPKHKHKNPIWVQAYKVARYQGVLERVTPSPRSRVSKSPQEPSEVFV